MKSKPVTAAEFVEQLKNDPEYQERVRQNARRAAQVLAVVEEEEDEVILPDLRAVGVRVHRLWDLVTDKHTDPRAIPVLLKHVQGNFSMRTLDTLIRTLIAPEAVGVAWPVLKELAMTRKRELLSSGAGEVAMGTLFYALGVLARKENLLDVLPLIADPEFGDCRIVLIDQIRKAKCDPTVLAKMTAFEPDKQIERCYRRLLERLGAPRASS